MAEIRAFFDESDQIVGDPPTVDPFTDGDTFEAGDETLTAMHLPGHTSGLCGFVRETETGRELLSGDAVLPVYTPNVGGADTRVDQPLAAYLDALSAIEAAGFTRAWPGHRDPIDDPGGRAREIIDHHRERTERVVETLRDRGPADAWTVSAALFGDLEGVHIIHGPGEAYAHLEHLCAHDVVTRTDAGYELLDDEPDIAAIGLDGA
jgi:hydroxyacylglutathione hydrolase